MRPRLRLAIADRAFCSYRQPKSLDASGGGDGGMLGARTPTRNAIELSSPVAFADRVQLAS